MRVRPCRARDLAPSGCGADVAVRAHANDRRRAAHATESPDADSAFLIDSGLSTPRAKAICAKNFYFAHRKDLRARIEKMRALARDFCLPKKPAREFVWRKKILVLSALFVRSAMRAQASMMCARKRASSKSRARRAAPTRPKRAPRTRFVKRETVFFVVL